LARSDAFEKETYFQALNFKLFLPLQGTQLTTTIMTTPTKANSPSRATTKPSMQVSPDIVHLQKSSSAAFTLACNASGLEDKEIYLALGIDAGYFSNIKKGKATLQFDLIHKFCELVDNKILPEWIASTLGCTLVMTETEGERRAKIAEDRYKASETENQLMRKLLSQGQSS
jgi:hypothetical protein